MDLSNFYQKLLGLESPWAVKSVTLDESSSSVRIEVCHPSGSLFSCPHCDSLCSVYDHRQLRLWRHLDSCGHTTYIAARLPRLSCMTCNKVVTYQTSWSRPHSHFTRCFEGLVLSTLAHIQVIESSAELLGISPDQVRYLMDKSVASSLANRISQGITSPVIAKHLCIDEKSCRKGHNYVTVLSNGETGEILSVTKDRTKVSTLEALQIASHYIDMTQVEVVSMDMWQAYQSAVKEFLPHVHIVYDRFHIAQYLNDAVDKTRRAEQKTRKKQDDNRLTNTRYLWLKNPQKYTPKQQEQWEQITAKEESDTFAIWQLKEEFKQFFSFEDCTKAEAFLEEWCVNATKLTNKYIDKVVKTLKNHWKGIISYPKYKVSNAMAECINSRIQQMKVKAKGFKTIKSFINAIMFYCAKLQI